MTSAQGEEALPGPSAPTVRQATHRDVDRVCAFGEAVIPSHYEPLIGAEAASRQALDWWSADIISAAVASGSLYVAEEGGELVGVAQVARHASPPTVYKLYLDPRHRGRGIGRVLLTAVTDALPHEARQLAIEHFAANERAAAFYEREGFRVDHVTPSQSGDPRLDVVWRVRTLG